MPTAWSESEPVIIPSASAPGSSGQRQRAHWHQGDQAGSLEALSLQLTKELGPQRPTPRAKLVVPKLYRLVFFAPWGSEAVFKTPSVDRKQLSLEKMPSWPQALLSQPTPHWRFQFSSWNGVKLRFQHRAAVKVKRAAMKYCLWVP